MDNFQKWHTLKIPHWKWLNSGWNETRGEGMQEKNSRQTWKEIESEMTRSVRKNRWLEKIETTVEFVERGGTRQICRVWRKNASILIHMYVHIRTYTIHDNAQGISRQENYSWRKVQHRARVTLLLSESINSLSRCHLWEMWLLTCRFLW